MPKDTSKQPADDGDQQPRRRSNRSSTREQTLLEKEAKKAEEARALVNLPPGQKYFYVRESELGPNCILTICPDNAGRRSHCGSRNHSTRP